jgi:hypothetical protein
VIAIDTDPVLLALGRTAYGDRDGLRFADVDLRSDGWTGALGLEQRRLSEDHHGSESVQLATHVAGLRAAGFAEIGTLWQRGENRILAGVLAP